MSRFLLSLHIKSTFIYTIPEGKTIDYKDLYGNSITSISNEDLGCLSNEYYEWVKDNPDKHWTDADQMELSLLGGVIILYITPIQKSGDARENILEYPSETIAVVSSSFVTNNLISKTEKLLPGLTTDFYLHGQAGIFNVIEDLYPTYWYGEFHPFEFEFVVNDKIG